MSSTEQKEAPDEDTPVSELTGEPREISGTEKKEKKEKKEKGGDEDEDFEFAIVSGGPGIISGRDSLFDGEIRPVYPVFGREVLLFNAGRRRSEKKKVEAEEVKSVRMSLEKLLFEEEKDVMIPSCSSSESDELEGLPADSYCVWTPGEVSRPLNLKKKSKSTGSASTSRRWRLRDLVVGRSHSDGGKKFIFLTQQPPETQTTSSKSTSTTILTSNRRLRKSADEAEFVEERMKRGKGKQGGRVSPSRLYYVRKDEMPVGDQRRSFLPYRKDLVGIFATVSGTSRGFHPF